MQDEIVARLANALNPQLTAAEARRAERAPHPDSVDLQFQGMAWLNKGPSPEYLARARGRFEHALALDPGNIEALVGTAVVDYARFVAFYAENRVPLLAAAEASLTKVLSVAPEHALAHLCMGRVQIQTNRARQGIAECERALALDRNLATAHANIGQGNLFLGRAEETEGHIREALRAIRATPSAVGSCSNNGSQRGPVGSTFCAQQETCVARPTPDVERYRSQDRLLLKVQKEEVVGLT